MSGMTTTGTTVLSDYSSRTVTIEVTGLCDQNVMRQGNFTYKVPYSRMSEMMKKIHRLGAQVVRVTTPSGDSSATSEEPATSEE